MQDLEHSFMLGDLERVASTAHRLKGNLASLGAAEAAAVAHSLEVAASNAEVEPAAGAWLAFEEAIDQVLPELTAIASVGPSAWR